MADLDGRTPCIIVCTVFCTIQGETGRERLGPCSGRKISCKAGSKKVYQLVSMLLELAGVDLVSSVKSGGLRSPRIWFSKRRNSVLPRLYLKSSLHHLISIIVSSRLVLCVFRSSEMRGTKTAQFSRVTAP